MMKLIKRLIITVCVLLMMNITLLCGLSSKWWRFLPDRILGCIILVTIICMAYLFLEIFPCYERGFKIRLQILSGGYELIITNFFCLFIEIAGHIIFYAAYAASPITTKGVIPLVVINGIVAFFVLLLHYLNGFWRTAIFSSQLGISLRVLMFFFWWLPPVNIILFCKWCAVVRRELIYEKHSYLLNQARAENTICRTRYPVVMVHGIFFRDWQYFNYWGRIPQALKRNGATVFYGKQQSSLSVSASAAELKEEIRRILAETGAEKVNIIAHSKGGLDARYAISLLGMEDWTASLTTVNTPHRGCQFVDVLLAKLPKWLICFVSARYNALFRRLGDACPDFLAGVYDLTAASCAVFNHKVQDSPKVYYQSVMSKMKTVKSAGFPLNIGYMLVKKYEGENDGLVSVSSAVRGNFAGLLTAGKKGISHGDMIDLTHKNIKGFDVSEFYVQLLAGLKEKGF